MEDFIIDQFGFVSHLILRRSKSGRKTIPYFKSAFSCLKFQEYFQIIYDIYKNDKRPLATILDVSASDISQLITPTTTHGLRVCSAKRLQSLEASVPELMSLGGWSTEELASYYSLAAE